jgi:hypothetical protein
MHRPLKLRDQSEQDAQGKSEILDPLTAVIGKALVRDLIADDVSKALIKIAAQCPPGRCETRESPSCASPPSPLRAPSEPRS